MSSGLDAGAVRRAAEATVAARGIALDDDARAAAWLVRFFGGYVLRGDAAPGDLLEAALRDLARILEAEGFGGLVLAVDCYHPGREDELRALLDAVPRGTEEVNR